MDLASLIHSSVSLTSCRAVSCSSSEKIDSPKAARNASRSVRRRCSSIYLTSADIRERNDSDGLTECSNVICVSPVFVPSGCCTMFCNLMVWQEIPFSGHEGRKRGIEKRTSVESDSALAGFPCESAVNSGEVG
jgi:hypothetical protein